MLCASLNQWNNKIFDVAFLFFIETYEVLEHFLTGRAPLKNNKIHKTGTPETHNFITVLS